MNSFILNSEVQDVVLKGINYIRKDSDLKSTHLREFVSNYKKTNITINIELEYVSK